MKIRLSGVILGVFLVGWEADASARVPKEALCATFNTYNEPNVRKLLHQSFEPPLHQTISNKTDFFYDAHLSSDEKWIIAAVNDTAKLYNVKTGSQIRAFEGHRGQVLSARFSHDNQRVITGSEDRKVKLWHIAGHNLWTLDGPRSAVFFAELSFDGTFVIALCRDGAAKVWKAQNNEFLYNLKGHQGKIKSAHFNRSASKIITSSFDESAQIWDTKDGSSQFTMKPMAKINHGQFSPDESKIILALANSEAEIRNAVDGQKLYTLKGHSGALICAHFSQDGEKAITASEDGTVKIWDWKNQFCLSTLQTQNTPILSAEFSPQENFVISVTKNALNIYDLRIWMHNLDVNRFYYLQALTLFLQYVPKSEQTYRNFIEILFEYKQFFTTGTKLDIFYKESPEQIEGRIFSTFSPLQQMSLSKKLSRPKPQK